MLKYFSKGISTTLGTIIIIILVVIFVGGILIYQMLTDDPTKDVWLESWEYRRVIIIENLRDKEILDYPVLLEINTSALIKEGKLASDCRDIRFTDPVSERFLKHWIEGECNSENAKLWVEVPLVVKSSQKKVHFYYGNGTAQDKAISLAANNFPVAGITQGTVLSDNQIRSARALNGDLYCVISKTILI